MVLGRVEGIMVHFTVLYEILINDRMLALGRGMVTWMPDGLPVCFPVLYMIIHYYRLLSMGRISGYWGYGRPAGAFFYYLDRDSTWSIPGIGASTVVTGGTVKLLVHFIVI